MKCLFIRSYSALSVILQTIFWSLITKICSRKTHVVLWDSSRLLQKTNISYIQNLSAAIKYYSWNSLSEFFSLSNFSLSLSLSSWTFAISSSLTSKHRIPNRKPWFLQGKTNKQKRKNAHRTYCNYSESKPKQEGILRVFYTLLSSYHVTE